MNLLLAASLTALGAFVPLPVPFATLGAPILPGAHELVRWNALSVGWCILSLQVPAVWIAALLLGPRLGFMCEALVLATGLAGLPIFAGGGGIGYLREPTFGYLLGFLPAVAIMGAFGRQASRAKGAPTPGLRDPRLVALGLVLGQGAMWAVGLVWQVVALHGLRDPAIWLASIRGTVQLGPSYLFMMAVLVAATALWRSLVGRPAASGRADNGPIARPAE